MTTTIRHAFVNPKADDADATHTRPSDWNGDHIISGTALATRTRIKGPYSVASGATVFIPDADIPRVGMMLFTDGGNSGAGIIQFYRSGTFNSVNGITVGNSSMFFQGSTYSAGASGFSFYIESNSTGARLAIKNNVGFTRDFSFFDPWSADNLA